MKPSNDVLSSDSDASSSGGPSSEEREVVRLPRELCDALREQIQGTRFKSVEEFLAYVLKEVTGRASAQADEKEKSLIEQRLRDLGYL